jgi:hypothetical protein
MKLLIEAPLIAENGVAVAHHEIISAVMTRDMEAMDITVSSWPTEQGRLDGASAASRWLVQSEIAAMSFADGMHSALIAAVLASEAFSGGSQVSDTSESLEAAKSRKLAELLAARGAREYSTFDDSDVVVNCDHQSQTRILGAASSMLSARMDWMLQCLDQLADAAQQTLPPPPDLAVEWTTSDEALLPLDSEGIGSLCDALSAHVMATHDQYRSLRDQTLAAQQPSEVAAISWA